MNERPDLTLDDFPQRRQVFAAEGGQVFIDERDEWFYVVTDESGMLGLLSDEDAADIPTVTIESLAAPPTGMPIWQIAGGSQLRPGPRERDLSPG
jgi:hypothetical protein